MSDPTWVPFRPEDALLWEPDKSPDLRDSWRWTGVPRQDMVKHQDLVIVSPVEIYGNTLYLPGAWSETWGTYDGSPWIHGERAYPLPQAQREAIRMYRAQRAYADRATR